MCACRFFFGLTRGLVAILLFFDTKKMAANNLKTLTMLRYGRSWSLDNDGSGMDQNHVPTADLIEQLASIKVDRLVEDGLIENILGDLIMTT